MILKIAHITLTMRDGGGGLESLIVNMARSMDPELYSVTVGCLDHGGSLLNHIHGMNYDSFVTGRRPGIDWKLIFKLARIFTKRKFQIVHSHNQTAHFYAGIAAKLARVPVIVITEHSRHNTELLWRRKLEKRLLYGITDKWVVVSKELAEQSMQEDGLGKSKLQVIRNGVEFTHYNNGQHMDVQQREQIKKQLDLPENSQIIIMVARLHPIKNHTLFLDTFAIINDKLPDVHVLFVGDGECRGALIQQSKKLNLENKIHFLGFQENVAELLGISDVFVLCSKTEGLPVSLLEACAAQVPVVITRPSNKAGLIKNKLNGIEVSDNPDDLADGLATILTNPEDAAEMALKSSKQVKKEFSLARMTREYENVYMDLLTEKGFSANISSGESA
ncbi:MAG TPA: glycosyltransferase [Desulfobacterales bacterium]|nr:glycosyltransferase [Desulfobacterales bacterium]HIP39394.1 glycosyltransferase [Desulfocapsa sulfexigens]